MHVDVMRVDVLPLPTVDDPPPHHHSCCCLLSPCTICAHVIVTAPKHTRAPHDVQPTPDSAQCNLAVYLCDPASLPSRLLISRSHVHSGTYINGGCSTGLARLAKGHYLVVPSTFDPVEAAFTITCYSSVEAAISRRPS